MAGGAGLVGRLEGKQWEGRRGGGGGGGGGGEESGQHSDLENQKRNGDIGQWPVATPILLISHSSDPSKREHYGAHSVWNCCFTSVGSVDSSLRVT